MKNVIGMRASSFTLVIIDAKNVRIVEDVLITIHASVDKKVSAPNHRLFCKV